MKEQFLQYPKNLLKLFGIKRNHLHIFSYWFPYIFFSGQAFLPKSLTFELTFRCNFNCKMCPLNTAKKGNRDRNQNKELSTQEIYRLFDEISQLGIKEITLTGGEPLLRRDFIEILIYAKAKGLKVSINTNGWLVDEGMAKKMVKIGTNSINFSLDGPEKVHDYIRGKKGSFNRIRYATHYLQAAKQELKVDTPSIAVSCTLSAVNQGCFSEILDTCYLWGVGSIDYDYLFFTEEKALEATKKMVPIGQIKDEDQVLPNYLREIDINIFQEELKRCREKARKYGLRVGFGPPLKNSEITSYFYDLSYSYTNKCFYPWYAARISPYGDVYPCSMDIAIGNVRKNPFSQLWNSEKFKEFRRALKKIRLYPKCTKCCVLKNKSWSYLPRI